MKATEKRVQEGYSGAKEQYAALGVDADAAVAKALKIPVSIHCWQVDDVVGFETKEEGLSGGGIMATGNYPGRARTADEARADYEKVLGLVAGAHRLNIHALYAETGRKVVDRDALEPHADYVVDDIGALPALFAGLGSNG